MRDNLRRDKFNVGVGLMRLGAYVTTIEPCQFSLSVSLRTARAILDEVVRCWPATLSRDEEVGLE